MATQSRRLESTTPAKVVGGAPHGFGVWIDGKFHRVDIGALGKLIVRLTEELEAARKELAGKWLSSSGTGSTRGPARDEGPL